MNSPAPTSSRPTTTLESQFLAPGKLAWVLDVCEETILREIARKRIEACKVGRLYRIAPEAALKYIAAVTVRADRRYAPPGGLPERLLPEDLALMWQKLEKFVVSAVEARLRLAVRQSDLDTQRGMKAA